MPNETFPRTCTGCGSIAGLCTCSNILARGPVCECSDPRCFELLNICWGEYDAAPGVIHIAATCRTPHQLVQVRMEIGETVTMEIGYSECAMSMRVAGKIMQVRLLPSECHGALAQLMEGGHEFSAPILVGEAGIYRDDDGYYYYLPMQICGGAR